jgi:hypothetical protein
MGEQEDFGCAGQVIAHDLFKGWQQFHKQSLFAYLTEVITAHARGDPIPALS